jgi:peptide subunit release factor RF-3
MIDLELEPLDHIEKIAELEYKRVNVMIEEEMEEIDDLINEHLRKYLKLTKSRKKDKIVVEKNGNRVFTHRTEEEFWEIVNTPCELSKEEIREFNKAPSYEGLQESIKKNGMGFIIYGENHRDKK